MISTARCAKELTTIAWAVAVIVIVIAEAEAGTLSTTYENDFFAFRDRYYTAGLSLRWYSDPRAGGSRYSLAIGQNLYTGRDIRKPDPSEDDRPYAGWLHLTAGVAWEEGNRQMTAEATVGVVGPSARGEEVQSTVHDWAQGVEPRGWDNQLHDETGVVARYTSRYPRRHAVQRAGWAVDWVPGWTLWAGNVYTAAEVDLVVRLGPDLPPGFSVPIFHPVTAAESHFEARAGGWYVHGRVVRRWVVRNLFLDGNTVRDSRSVEKEPVVDQLFLGIAFYEGRWQASYTHTLLSKEFKTQRGHDAYGVVQVAWKF